LNVFFVLSISFLLVIGAMEIDKNYMEKYGHKWYERNTTKMHHKCEKSTGRVKVGVQDTRGYDGVQPAVS
jgi:hypothetical protein